MVIEWKWLFENVMKGWAGITIWPFIFVKDKSNERLLRHEKCHIRQQTKGLVIGFYIKYLYEYFLGRIRGKNKRKAYQDISYEIEARKAEDHG